MRRGNQKAAGCSGGLLVETDVFSHHVTNSRLSLVFDTRPDRERAHVQNSPMGMIGAV
jgi:hypothetical protein